MENKEEESEDDDDEKKKEKVWYQKDTNEPAALECAKGNFTTKENPDSIKRITTPVFFRYGFYKQMKINTNNFIEKAFVADTWYKLDLLIDWK